VSTQQARPYPAPFPERQSTRSSTHGTDATDSSAINLDPAVGRERRETNHDIDTSKATASVFEDDRRNNDDDQMPPPPARSSTYLPPNFGGVSNGNTDHEDSPVRNARNSIVPSFHQSLSSHSGLQYPNQNTGSPSASIRPYASKDPPYPLPLHDDDLFSGYIGPSDMLAQSSTASCIGENVPVNHGSLGHDFLQGDEEDRLQHRDYSNPVEALHQAPLAKQDSSPQVEEIAPWCDISYFIGLYLRYQHALMPLVHKPTFTNDIVLRKDRSDETFRALLLSLSEWLEAIVGQLYGSTRSANLGDDQLTLYSRFAGRRIYLLFDI
jgi:hypothetical protein